jgi:hypothetical protein
MPTKLYSYRCECDKAGVAIYVRARNDKDAFDKLIGHPGYWQAQKKFKVNKADWKVEKEI